MRGLAPETDGKGARIARAPAPQPHYLRSSEAPHLVAYPEKEPMLAALRTVMPEWGLHRVEGPADPAAPVSTITRPNARRYTFQSWWSRMPLGGLGLAGATCGAVADLVQSHCDARPGTLGLHCGALRIGGHLVALTGPYRAGKSTLVTRLGSDPDVSLFCDDILPILPEGDALALGIQPRLRLPLPDGVSPAFRDYVARNLTAHDHRYGYVHLPHQAPYGTRAPLAALVVLRREENAPARLHRLERGDAAAHLIRQNIADPGDPEAHYDRISALVDRLSCLTLVYSDLDDAAALMHAAFDGPALPAPGLPLEAPVPPEPVERPALPADLGLRFSRAGDVSDRVIGGNTFLWHMEERRFFALNPVAGAIWTLIETPLTGHEIVRILTDLFPDAPAAVLAQDLEGLLGQLVANNLVRAGI